MATLTGGGGSDSATLTIYFASDLSSAITSMIGAVFGPEPLLGVDLYTPPSLVAPTPGAPDSTLLIGIPNDVPVAAGLTVPVPGDLNIENGAPRVARQVVKLNSQAQGLILTGSKSAKIIGHSGFEFLVGNDGNDTIRAHGGSGTIISGTGSNVIYAGSGSTVVLTGSGADTILAGSGTTDVTAFGNATFYGGSGSATVTTEASALIEGGSGSLEVTADASATIYGGSGVTAVNAKAGATVHGGTGLMIFTDKAAAGSALKLKAGSGTTIAFSGLGSDTFIGGSGTSLFQDTGGGDVDFVFKAALAGTDIVQGYRGADTVAMVGFGSISQADITVAGGSSFVELQGTRLEFVGITSLTPASFSG